MAATFGKRSGALRASALVVLLVTALPAASQPSRTADFDRMLRDQAQTDRRWREASVGFMQMEKISYRSRADDLDIPAFVFQPLQVGNRGSHPALVWVHENIRGHLYEHYIPYIREAATRGYVVIAPEYRGCNRLWSGVVRSHRLRRLRDRGCDGRGRYPGARSIRTSTGGGSR